MIEYKNGDYIPTVKSNLYNNSNRIREYNRVDIFWIPRNVIKIQKIIRGFLDRRKVQQNIHFQYYSKLVIKIQANVRRFIYR